MTPLTDHRADCEAGLIRLAAAEEALTRARTRVARQREIVAALKGAGHEPTQAERLLATFEAERAHHERQLALLLDELTARGWTTLTP
jgi:phage terminase Nu1 subunit (DNA packaging protein)